MIQGGSNEKSKNHVDFKSAFYFQTPVWIAEAPMFLKNAIKVTDKYIKKADKLYESKRTDRYAPNEKNLSEETKKVNKQLKTAKNIAIGTGGAMAAAGVYGKAKQAFKEKD